MKNIFYIGGSPCSGKSTIAQIIADKYEFGYFKVDDYLDKYIKLGAKNCYDVCKKQCEFSSEEIWMRDSNIQCKEELVFYEEIFDFVINDLKKVQSKNGIITEGAAYLPNLMKMFNVQNDRYISIIPTEEFQLYHYKQRTWVWGVLEGCKDKNKAFNKWMKRDILFAKEVEERCIREEYNIIINNGDNSIDELVKQVEEQFKL